jgi:anti-sigma factor RsiW
MKKQIYNEELIVQYLLGSLSEEETERLDELCFVDDEFAERLSAVENDLVDTYVRGELSSRNLKRFDSHYLASPRRREKVKIARAFQIHAGRTVTAGQAQFAPEPSSMNDRSRKPFPRLALPQGLFNLPRLVLTAVAILGTVGVGWLVFELSRLRGQVDQARATRIALERREKELQELLER